MPALSSLMILLRLVFFCHLYRIDYILSYLKKCLTGTYSVLSIPGLQQQYWPGLLTVQNQPGPSFSRIFTNKLLNSNHQTVCYIISVHYFSMFSQGVCLTYNLCMPLLLLLWCVLLTFSNNRLTCLWTPCGGQDLTTVLAERILPVHLPGRKNSSNDPSWQKG